MKKLSLLIAMIAFACGNIFAQSLYFDFEGQTAGNKIAQTLGEPWTTWSNAPGGAEDGVFDMADGSMAAHFTYGNDQVLRLGGIESGVFDLVFDAFVPNGKNGYFNVLHNFAGGGSTWAAQFYLCASNDGQNTTPGVGHGTVHAGSNGTADIPCVWDEWMQYRVHIDMDQDLATLYWNVAGDEEQEICSWQWSLDSFGENTVGRTLDAMDFFPPENAATSEFFIDNIGIISGADDQVLIDDDFEAYPLGGKIAESAIAIGNDWWTTWTNQPGGNEDGVIAEAGNTQCGYISGSNDNVLLLGGQESGTYDLEFAIYCDEGKYGYFNILHEFNGSGSTWAMQAYLNATNDGSTASTTYSVGHGTVHAGANSNGDIPAVVNEWMFFRIHVDLDADEAELFYRSETTQPEEISIVAWQWSLDSFGSNVVGRKMDAMDFYAPNATQGCYYLDNFRYTRIGQETHATLDFDTSDIYVELGEDDATSVEIEISNENGTSIGDWTGWIDFGTTTVTTGNNQLNYDLDPDMTTGANVSLVGLSIDAAELVEVGAMFPGNAYAAAAMGAKIVSAQYTFFEGTDSGIGLEPNTPVTFRIYGQGMYGQPGEVLAEKVVPYNQIIANDWTIATFDTPVDLTGFNVWVTCEFTQAVSGYPMNFDEGANSGYGDYYRTNGGGAFNRCSETFSTDYGNFHIRINTVGAPVESTWATLSKPEGTIAIGDTDEVLVNFNSIGMADQTRKEAEVIFKTNDPDNEEYRVPITLFVDYLSVAENSNEAYEIYPNPATTMVTLKGENLSHVAIYNVAGQLVRVVKLNNVVNNIDMNVEAGVYFFSIYDNNGGNNVQRVVIAK
ncbi:MAG: T9SS type A sorting domain-containing protein [Bacteroidales bacterium]|nr:T9SS type A sorting domain-containing protein [Bacteroidales bacterium]